MLAQEAAKAKEDSSEQKESSKETMEKKASSSEQEVPHITKKKIEKAQVALMRILKGSENNMYESSSVKIKSIFPHSFEEVARKKPDRSREVKQDITEQISELLGQLNIEVDILDDRMLDENT